MLRTRTLALAVAGAMAVATSGHAALLFSEDFDGGGAFGAGISGSFGGFTLDTATVGSWNAAGWSGTFGKNTTTGNPATFSTLSLSGLAAHSSITASFILGFLESWDSRDGNPSPDNLEVWVDGTRIFEMTSDNASGLVEDYDVFTEIADGAQVNTGNTSFSDTLIDGSFTFAHSASTLTLGIRAAGAGWQGGTDESWGIDDVLLTYEPRVTDPIPEPATWALMIAGFGLAGSALRRRRVVAA